MKNTIIFNLLLLSGIAQAQTNKADVFSGGGGAMHGNAYSNFGTFAQPLSSATWCISYMNREGFIKAQLSYAQATTTGDQSVCFQAPVETLVATIMNTEGPLLKQWQKFNGTNWTDIYQATQNTYNPGPLTQTSVYRFIVNDRAGCGTVASNSVTITVYPPFEAGTISSNQVILQNTAPALLTGTIPTGGTPPYSYQWEVSEDNLVFSSISGATSLDFQPGILSATNWFRMLQVSPCGPGVTTNKVVIHVIVVPQTLSVTNVTIFKGMSKCYNAQQTLTVAGNGTTFKIKAGGLADLIAGQQINMLPGTHVEPGGYLHAFITTTGQYCFTGQITPPAKTSSITQESGITPPGKPEDSFVCFPNPNTGVFTLRLGSEPGVSPVTVRIYNSLGKEIQSQRIFAGRNHAFSIENQVKGVYFMMVEQNGQRNTVKVVRQ